MSWFDDDDAFSEGFLKELVDPENEGIEEDIEEPELLEVGDTVADLYVVEDMVRPGIAKVRLMGGEHSFELRQFPELSQKRVRTQVEFVVNTTSFLDSEHLTYITDFGVCPIFGGYVVSEWVDGESLSSMLETGNQMELAEAAGFVLQVGLGLSVLHEVGLAYGFRGAHDLVRDTNQHWRLRAIGLGSSVLFPPQSPLPVAPELQGVRGNSAQGDQYGLASALYGLLVGEVPVGDNPLGPSDLRVDLPESLDFAVMRAMSDNPEERFATIEEFLEAVIEAVQRWQEMSSFVHESSFVQESSAVHEPSFAFGKDDTLELPNIKKTATPSEFAALSYPIPSVLVTVENALGNRPSLSMSFANIERVRREFRNHIMFGGVFVPTPKQLRRNQVVEIELVFEPTGGKIRVEGTVAKIIPASPTQLGGVELSFEETAKIPIRAFLKPIDPVLGLAQTDVITAIRALDIHSQLEPYEAFLLSRLNQPMPLSMIRAAFQDLPFNFEDALGGLILKDYVAVKHRPVPVNPPRASQRPKMVPRVEAEQTGSAHTVPEGSVRKAKSPLMSRPGTPTKTTSYAERALEQAASLQQKGNFRAAIEILEAAHSAIPDTRFLLRLVKLYGTFQKNWEKANEYLNEAARIMPNDPEVTKMREWVASQSEDELVRVVYTLDTTGAKVRFLRIDPQSRRLWFEVYVSGSRTRREIHVVDYARGRGSMLRQALDPMRMSVVPGNTPELASFDMAREHVKNTKLGRREKLLDRAQSSVDLGPWFRKGPAPVAWTTNSRFLVFDRNPDELEEGLYIVNQGSDMAPLRLDPEGTRGVRPILCPDDSGCVAWVSLRPSPTVYIAEPFQTPQKRFEMKGDAIVHWLGPDKLIVLSIATGEILEVSRRGETNRSIATLKNACGIWLTAAEHLAAVLTSQRVVHLLEVATGKVLGELKLATFPEDMLLRDDGYLALRYRDHTAIARFGRTKVHKIDVVADPGCFSSTVRWAGREPLVLMVVKSDQCEVLRVDPRQLFGG